MAGGKLRIGAFIFDPARGVATGEQGEISIEPKVAQVLIALAERPGEVVTRDALMAQVWKTEFGGDESLSRAISQLRKMFGDERGAPRYIETIPKRGYRLMVPVASFEETALADLAPAVSDSAQVTPLARKSLSWSVGLIAATIVLATGVATLALPARLFSPPDVATAANRVELQPLHVIDGDAATMAFATRAAVTLGRVLTSNQVEIVDASARPPASGALPANAEFALSGTLERIAEQYSVTLRFDSRHDGQTLWWQSYTRPVGDSEDMREEVAFSAAAVIQCALADRAHANVEVSTAAFKIYLEACQALCFETPDDVHGTLGDSAQRLMAIAPRDAHGYGLAALSHIALSGSLDTKPDDSEKHLAAGRQLAARALELDGKNQTAALALALLAPAGSGFAQREAYLERSGLVQGSRRGAVLYLAHLRQLGRLREAADYAEGLVARYRLALSPRLLQAVLEIQNGRYEAGDKLLQGIARRWPGDDSASWYRLVGAMFYGAPDDAMKQIDAHEGINRDGPGKMGCMRAFVEARAAGSFDTTRHEAFRAACGTNTIGDESMLDYQIRMASALGDLELAYTLAVEKDYGWDGATVFLFYPEMAPFQRDRRFMPLIARSGLLDYWTKTGHWPDFCRDPELPYDCKAAASQALAEPGAGLSAAPT